MLFITKRQFEEEVAKRVNEARDRDWLSDRTYKLEERISKVEYKVAKLEGKSADERKTASVCPPCPQNVEDIEI